MKKILLAGSLLFLALSLSVYAGGDSEGKKAGSSEVSKEKTKLTVWGGIPGENGPQQVAENYMKLHPDIEVEYIRYVNDETGNVKLDTALLSGDQVDVFMSHGADRTSSRIVGGLAEALDGYVQASGIDPVKDFGEAYNTFNGKTYALAITKVDDFMWINKKMFDAAGIPVPTEWTWDEYRAIAKKLTKGEGEAKVYGSMLQIAWPDIWMKPAFIALGPKSYSSDMVFNLTDPMFKHSLQLRYDLENTDQSQVPVTLQKSAKLTLQDMFFKEKVAMFYGGSWIIRYAKNLKDFPHDFISAFAPLPTWEKGTKNYYNSCGALDEYLSINSKSPSKDAAWDYIRYYATEGYNPMIAGGKIPAWRGADADQVAKLLLGDNPEKLFDIDSFKRVIIGGNGSYFVTPLSPVRREIATILEQEAEKAIIKDQSVNQAIETMIKKSREIVSKSN
jgi:multiple sugar transport system substrate-binding protein